MILALFYLGNEHFGTFLGNACFGTFFMKRPTTVFKRNLGLGFPTEDNLFAHGFITIDFRYQNQN
jgi:hypothetical protein